MAAKILPVPAVGAQLLRNCKGLPAQTLVAVGPPAEAWNEALRASQNVTPWSFSCQPVEPDWNHWKGPRGGLVWYAGQSPPPSPPPSNWKLLGQPWPRLARWYLEGLALQFRHVTLLAPPWSQLEGLCSWLVRQGASVSWVGEASRQIWAQLRLADIALVLPGVQTEIEARHLSGGSTLLDFRPGSTLRGSALEITLEAFADAETGSLDLLCAALALSLPGQAQQETPHGLA